MHVRLAGMSSSMAGGRSMVPAIGPKKDQFQLCFATNSLDRADLALENPAPREDGPSRRSGFARTPAADLWLGLGSRRAPQRFQLRFDLGMDGAELFHGFIPQSADAAAIAV